MSRRGLPPLLLVVSATAVGTYAALLVARVPPPGEERIVTRRDRSPDPLLTAALLRYNVESLLHHPSRYFRPPFLYPDPNPLRGTEPLLAETLLAVPFRLALGAQPAAIYTAVRLTTLALLAVFTALMLRELGTGASLAIMGGCLSVLVGTTAVFFDRLQAVSLQWLPLGVFFAARFLRQGRLSDAVAAAVSAFLTVQASLYTAVMLLAVAPFLAPLLWTLRGARWARRRVAGLALALAAAGVVSVVVLWPYLRDRADITTYANADFAADKAWWPAHPANLLASPREFSLTPWPSPAPAGDGLYPGAAFLLLLAATGALAAADRVQAPRAPRATAAGGGGPTHGMGRIQALLGAGLLVSVGASALGDGGRAATLAADACLWGALLTGSLRLARFRSWTDEEERLGILARVAALAATVLLLLGLGSPITWTSTGPAVAGGIFGPLSELLSPLRELRELKRFLLPAGWAAVVAGTLALERRLRSRPPRWAGVLAFVVLALGVGERLNADTRSIRVHPVPGDYRLLAASSGRGGLLELPVDSWGKLLSVHRMLWQPSHGRPIVAGRTGVQPGWYAPAHEVLNEFPSEESVLLLRAWGIDSILDLRSEEARPAEGLLRLPNGLVLRASEPGPGGDPGPRLFDLLPGASTTSLGPEPSPGPGAWQVPRASAEDGSALLAIDGSLETAAEVDGRDGLVLQLSGDEPVAAIELDYGHGRFGEVPPSLRVLGLLEEGWRDLTVEPTGRLLRTRAADQLMKHRAARLTVLLRPHRVRGLRLASSGVRWSVPEVRVLVAAAP